MRKIILNWPLIILMELFKVCMVAPISGADGLYLRLKAGNIDVLNGTYVLSPNSIVSTDTYFNIFSSSKYGEYTNAEKISITTAVSGKLDVELHSCSENGDETIKVQKVDANVSTELTFSFNIDGLDDAVPVCHYLLYRSYQKSNIHSFGSYVSDIKPSDINLGVVICTFQRESRALNTLDKINEIISNKDYGLHNKIRVYLVDNDRSIEHSSIKHDHVKLIPNGNDGGSGGFARGMIEARRENMTHVVLMDDDVEIDPNVIYKTFNLVSILKDKHKDAFILGGMLLPETPNIQYEAGAEYKLEFKRGKHMLDMLSRDALLLNDKKEPADYGGWWYTCMPSVAAEELPLPMFIKMDDVEFGIRRMYDHIVINGIGIWHDSFESKDNPVIDYYFHRRNLLIFDALHNRKNGFQIGAGHFRRMLHCIKEGKSIEYYYTRRAVYDFLKGPEFLANTDQEKSIAKMSSKKDQFNSKEITFGATLFKDLWSLSLESIKVVTQFNNLSIRYREGVKYMSSIEYWENRQKSKDFSDAFEKTKS